MFYSHLLVLWSSCLYDTLPCTKHSQPILYNELPKLSEVLKILLVFKLSTCCITIPILQFPLPHHCQATPKVVLNSHGEQSFSTTRIAWIPKVNWLVDNWRTSKIVNWLFAHITSCSWKIVLLYANVHCIRNSIFAIYCRVIVNESNHVYCWKTYL